MTNAAFRPGHRPSLSSMINQSLLGINPRMFVSPPAAGRKITAGFSFIHRICKTSSIDVWFPEALQRELDMVLDKGQALGPQHFPAQWAAVRQFELLQESGNYKIYDMDVTHLQRTMMDLSRNMRAGGYRVTVATLGSYSDDGKHDDLEVLDKRLQDRIARLIHMLYLEEQSGTINLASDKVLAEEKWDFRTALPHIGATLGARDLFWPVTAKVLKLKANYTISFEVPEIIIPNWLKDHGVHDVQTGLPFPAETGVPARHHYSVRKGCYRFAAEDAGRDVTLHYTVANNEPGQERGLSPDERKHRLARKFFDVLNLLPQKHIVHDTAVGLQLPESINENEWIYTAPGDETLGVFHGFLKDIFAPFDKISLSGLNGHEDAKPEVKASVQHMRGYGDRMNADSDAFYAKLAQMTLS